jgi:hypothetical protein
MGKAISLRLIPARRRAELMRRLRAHEIKGEEFLAVSKKLPPAEKEKLTRLLIEWGQEQEPKRRVATLDREQDTT